MSKLDSTAMQIAIEVRADADASRVRELVRSGPVRTIVPMLVANRITADARALLNEAGWSWLDRRGRLHIRGPGVRIDMDIEPHRTRLNAHRDPLRTRAGPAVRWRAGRPGPRRRIVGHAAHRRVCDRGRRGRHGAARRSTPLHDRCRYRRRGRCGAYRGGRVAGTRRCDAGARLQQVMLHGTNVDCSRSDG